MYGTNEWNVVLFVFYFQEIFIPIFKHYSTIIETTYTVVNVHYLSFVYPLHKVIDNVEDNTVDNSKEIKKENRMQRRPAHFISFTYSNGKV